MKNKCLESGQLQDYLDHNLSAKQQKDCEQHLKDCADCRQELEAFTRLYQVSAEHSVRQISAKASSRQIESVMNRITQQNKKPQKSEKINLGDIFSGNVKWLFAPVFVVVSLLIIVLINKPEQKNTYKPSTTRFSLESNVVETVFDPGVMLRVGSDKQLKLSEFNKVPVGKAVQLPKDAMIIVRIADSQIKLSEEAMFGFSKKEMKLAAGNATIELKNPHPGFIVKMPFAEVSPLGTKFSLEVNKHFIKIQLEEGQLAIAGRTGIKRILSQPGHIFVSPKGQFSDQVPQIDTTIPVMPNELKDGHNAHTPGDDGSPQRILDSF